MRGGIPRSIENISQIQTRRFAVCRLFLLWVLHNTDHTTTTTTTTTTNNDNDNNNTTSTTTNNNNNNSNECDAGRVDPTSTWPRSSSQISSWPRSQLSCVRGGATIQGIFIVRGPLIISLYVLIQPYLYKHLLGKAFMRAAVFLLMIPDVSIESLEDSLMLVILQRRNRSPREFASSLVFRRAATGRAHVSIVLATYAQSPY